MMNEGSKTSGAVHREEVKEVSESESSFREVFPCPYLQDGRMASIRYLFAPPDIMSRFDLFLSGGYRRLGAVLYRNVCEGCCACRPIRLRPSSFTPGRSQRRTTRKNADLHVEIPPRPSVTYEKIALYKEYLLKKHAQEQSTRECEELLSGLHYGYPGAIEMDYYLDDRLVGVGIVDEGPDSLSSNYFYYDAACPGKRLGVFSVLKEISLAVARRKKFYYLGFYIEEISRMSYKKSFRPNEVLGKSGWKKFMP